MNLVPERLRSQSQKKFWDCEGILFIDFKKCNTTVNSPYYKPLLH